MALVRKPLLFAVVASAFLATVAPTPAVSCCNSAITTEKASELISVVGTLVSAFQLFKSQHMTAAGRIVDNANNDISHSEGQGYAMLIAAKLGDSEAFEAVWNWTKVNLQVRDDKLLAWKWDPAASPHVIDRNNATDGDILIVWALVEGGRLWNNTEYLRAAREIALDVAERAVVTTPLFGDVLLPGVAGFSASERPDGPVVNQSYWVYPAVDALTLVVPEVNWETIFENGVAILERSTDNPHGLPSEWSSLSGDTPSPADGFDAVFGYNAIRIPLYLAWSEQHSDALDRFRGLYDPSNHLGPFVIDLQSGAPVSTFREVGFRAVAMLTECALGGERSDDMLIDLASPSGLYYPDTLHILSALAQLEKYPRCF